MVKLDQSNRGDATEIALGESGWTVTELDPSVRLQAGRIVTLHRAVPAARDVVALLIVGHDSLPGDAGS
ncbi:MAG: hypothetical protein IIC92_05605 [Chloroflexi bacterium]|nr:hypothetical protein [Chloroflexota bacterium]MCH8817189.1 hypothetical protein [Chloroflexota bacterium]